MAINISHNSIINKQLIIKYVKKNITPNNKYFYKNIINYFKINKINEIINENINELTGYIIYLLSNHHKYHIGIIINKNVPNDVIYRKKKINDKQLINLYYCLSSNNFKYDKITNIKKNNIIYICISKYPLKFDLTPNKINNCSLTQLFGIENFNILNYINFTHLLI